MLSLHLPLPGRKLRQMLSKSPVGTVVQVYIPAEAAVSLGNANLCARTLVIANSS